jgi:hypothetical protein
MERFNEDLTALTYRVRLLWMGDIGTGATAGDCCSEGSAEIGVVVVVATFLLVFTKRILSKINYMHAYIHTYIHTYSVRAAHYRGADKFVARPTFRCILFDGENISFDASLVIYI